VDFTGRSGGMTPTPPRGPRKARLYRKGGQQTKLGYMGPCLMEKPAWLVVDGRLTQATGDAERRAAPRDAREHPRPWEGNPRAE